MRIRLAVLGAVLVAATAACSDDPQSDDQKPDPSAPLTEVTVDCKEYADTAKAITEAQTVLYSGGEDTSRAIDTLIAELDALKEDAPADIQTALTSLGDGFKDAEVILSRPTQENMGELAALAPKLAEDGQKVTAYIKSKCD